MRDINERRGEIGSLMAFVSKRPDTVSVPTGLSIETTPDIATIATAAVDLSDHRLDVDDHAGVVRTTDGKEVRQWDHRRVETVIKTGDCVISIANTRA